MKKILFLVCVVAFFQESAFAMSYEGMVTSKLTRGQRKKEREKKEREKKEREKKEREERERERERESRVQDTADCLEKLNLKDKKEIPAKSQSSSSVKEKELPQSGIAQEQPEEPDVRTPPLTYENLNQQNSTLAETPSQSSDVREESEESTKVKEVIEKFRKAYLSASSTPLPDSDTNISDSEISEEFDEEEYPFRVNLDSWVLQNIRTCGEHNYLDFMKKNLELMKNPKDSTMIKHYGFGMGHVPLLLVWSGHLYDKMTKNNIYCMTTEDIKDILTLILIVDLRAQVDAVCIEKVGEELENSDRTYSTISHEEFKKQSETAPKAASYLKEKLAQLWGATILDRFRKHKLPKYPTVLKRVKNILNHWKEKQLPSPVWVCCPQHASYMLVANSVLWSNWRSDYFGNWWNPGADVIAACNNFEKSKDYCYKETRNEKTEETFKHFKKIKSWEDYFGDFLSIKQSDGSEYDSDGGF